MLELFGIYECIIQGIKKELYNFENLYKFFQITYSAGYVFFLRKHIKCFYLKRNMFYVTSVCYPAHIQSVIDFFLNSL